VKRLALKHRGRSWNSKIEELQSDARPRLRNLRGALAMAIVDLSARFSTILAVYRPRNEIEYAAP
jgi:hypothetical protein